MRGRGTFFKIGQMKAHGFADVPDKVPQDVSRTPFVMVRIASGKAIHAGAADRVARGIHLVDVAFVRTPRRGRLPCERGGEHRRQEHGEKKRGNRSCGSEHAPEYTRVGIHPTRTHGGRQA